MRTRARLRPASLFAAAALCWIVPFAVGCGGGSDTFNSTLVNASAPRFTLAVTQPSVSVVQGGTATYTVTLTAVNGFAASVTLRITGLPAGATAAFAPTPLTPTAAGVTTTLTVTTTSSVPVGTSALVISAVGGNGQQQATSDLVVTAPPSPGSLQGSIQ